MYDIEDTDLMEMSIEQRNGHLDEFAANMAWLDEVQAKAEVDAERRNEFALAFPGDGFYAGSEEEARDRWLDSLVEEDATVAFAGPVQDVLPVFDQQAPLPGFEG